MATAVPSHGRGDPSAADLRRRPPLNWSHMRYRNAALAIVRASVVESDTTTEEEEEGEEVILRVLFHVSTLRLMSPDRHNRSTCVELCLSQLERLRETILDFVLRRPDLDHEGGYADFLYVVVGCFVHDVVDGFSSSFQGTRRMQELEVEVSVEMDEPMPPPEPATAAVAEPQLIKRVVYKFKERDGDDDLTVAVRETACPICLQEFDVGEEVGVTPCAHPFHPTCLARWLREKPFCPLCRSLLSSRGLHDSD